MTVLEGWELTPDRRERFDKIMDEYDIGDPILISKCKLAKRHGLLVVSDKGFAWRFKMSFASANIWRATSGKSKWIRWHDVARIIPEKERKGKIKIEMYKRKGDGTLKMRWGKPKVFRWRAIVQRNRGEDKRHFKGRRKDFYRLMNEIYKRNKVEQPPPYSDSNM